jgi:hypothetical protein
MSTITVLPNDPTSANSFVAIAGDKKATGSTVGQAIDELRAQLDGPDETTLVIIQPMVPDQFFPAEQRARLGDLMARLHAARDGGPALSTEDRRELHELVQAELRASGARAAALLQAVPA